MCSLGKSGTYLWHYEIFLTELFWDNSLTTKKFHFRYIIDRVCEFLFVEAVPMLEQSILWLSALDYRRQLFVTNDQWPMASTNNNNTYSLITIIKKLFAYFRPVLAITIPTASRTFESFLNKVDTIMSVDSIKKTQQWT